VKFEEEAAFVDPRDKREDDGKKETPLHPRPHPSPADLFRGSTSCRDGPRRFPWILATSARMTWEGVGVFATRREDDEEGARRALREDDGKEATHAASSPSSVMTALVAFIHVLNTAPP
jgi:hypothetical protein